MKLIAVFMIPVFLWASSDVLSSSTCSSRRWGSYFVSLKQHALFGHTFMTRSGTSRIRCSALCLRHSRCLSFNYDETAGDCELNDSTHEESPGSLEQALGLSYFASSEASCHGEYDTTTVVNQASTDNSGSSTDDSGNTITVDIRSPIVTCPNDVYSYTVDNTSSVQVKWSGTPSAADDVDGAVAYSCRGEDGTAVGSGSDYDSGNTTITCSAVDAAGNAGECSFVVSVIVCGCCGPLGIESGLVPDTQITASDVLDDDYANYGPTLARLNGNSSWCGQSIGSWIQVDVSRLVNLYGLVIQGRASSPYFVSSFYLSYSNDTVAWTDVLNEDSSKRKFSSSVSSHKDVTVPVQSASQATIRTRFIRVSPRGFSTGGMCLRLEFIGCI